MGSNVSILQPGVSQSGLSATFIKPHGVTGEAPNIKGQQHVFCFWRTKFGPQVFGMSAHHRSRWLAWYRFPRYDWYRNKI